MGVDPPTPDQSHERTYSLARNETSQPSDGLDFFLFIPICMLTHFILFRMVDAFLWWWWWWWCGVAGWCRIVGRNQIAPSRIYFKMDKSHSHRETNCLRYLQCGRTWFGSNQILQIWFSCAIPSSNLPRPHRHWSLIQKTLRITKLPNQPTKFHEAVCRMNIVKKC